MARKIIYFLLAVILVSGGVWYFNSAKKTPGNLASISLSKKISMPEKVAELPKNNQVCIKESCFEVELALTDQQRAIGLMNREKLDINKGMLFIFDASNKYGFWMKNTLIPLDIIWIDKYQKVAFISKNTQPCQNNAVCPAIAPDKEALYVLEINAGLVEQNNIQINDQVKLYTGN